MKKILVPTDFSPCADNAINFAVQLAKAGSMEVILMHSYETMGSVYVDYMGANKEHDRVQMDEAGVKLRDIKNDIQQKEGIEVATTMYDGSVSDTLQKAIDERAIDIVIMGTHGASGLQEKLWGSKTGSVIGKCSVPLVVIPTGYKESNPENILFATHHFEETDKVLNPIFEIATLFGASVQLAVFSDDDDDNASIVMEHTRGIKDYEEKLKKKFNADTLTANHLTGKEFMETMQEYITNHKIDVLAMVTHQRNFFDRIFNPSITKKMAYQTTVPLLVIPE